MDIVKIFWLQDALNSNSTSESVMKITIYLQDSLYKEEVLDANNVILGL